MRSVFKTIIAASALAATSVAVVQPAQARDNTGVAVAAGIIGLGVGAALASDHRGYNRGYGGGYYNDYPAYNYPSSYGYYAPAYSYGYGYDRGRGWGRDNWRGDRRDRGHDRWDRHDRRDGRWGR
jgi:hypothetical protein